MPTPEGSRARRLAPRELRKGRKAAPLGIELGDRASASPKRLTLFAAPTLAAGTAAGTAHADEA